MTETPLAPMVDYDVDLREFQAMPLKVLWLRNSEFNAQVEDAEFRAGVNLWCAAWHEVPAASLPNDDKALCRMAGLHRDLETWHRVKKGAMWKFELCSDGRWYHPIIADIANEAWEKKRRNVGRTANATAARLRRNEKNNRRDESGDDAQKATKGREEKGEEGKGLTPSGVRNEAEVAVSMWNRMAEKIKLPKALTKLSDARRKKLDLRLSELDGLEGWAILLQKIEDGPFLRGENDTGWTATIDWVLEPRNLTKIMEGNYANRPSANRKGSFAGLTQALTGGDFESE